MIAVRSTHLKDIPVFLKRAEHSYCHVLLPSADVECIDGILDRPERKSEILKMSNPQRGRVGSRIDSLHSFLFPARLAPSRGISWSSAISYELMLSSMLA